MSPGNVSVVTDQDLNHFVQWSQMIEKVQECEKEIMASGEDQMVIASFKGLDGLFSGQSDAPTVTTSAVNLRAEGINVSSLCEDQL